MNKTRSTGNVDGILLDAKTYYSYVNCGRKTAIQIAEAAGAVRRFGRTVRYFKPAIDRFLEDQGGKQAMK